MGLIPCAADGRVVIDARRCWWCSELKSIPACRCISLVRAHAAPLLRLGGRIKFGLIVSGKVDRLETVADWSSPTSTFSFRNITAPFQMQPRQTGLADRHGSADALVATQRSALVARRFKSPLENYWASPDVCARDRHLPLPLPYGRRPRGSRSFLRHMESPGGESAAPYAVAAAVTRLLSGVNVDIYRGEIAGIDASTVTAYAACCERLMKTRCPEIFDRTIEQAVDLCLDTARNHASRKGVERHHRKVTLSTRGLSSK